MDKLNLDDVGDTEKLNLDDRLSSFEGPYLSPRRDALIISVADTLTSLLAGFTIFSILGNLAFELNKPVRPDFVQIPLNLVTKSLTLVNLGRRGHPERRRPRVHLIPDGNRQI